MPLVSCCPSAAPRFTRHSRRNYARTDASTSASVPSIDATSAIVGSAFSLNSETSIPQLPSFASHADTIGSPGVVESRSRSSIASVKCSAGGPTA